MVGARRPTGRPPARWSDDIVGVAGGLWMTHDWTGVQKRSSGCYQVEMMMMNNNICIYMVDWNKKTELISEAGILNLQF